MIEVPLVTETDQNTPRLLVEDQNTPISLVNDQNAPERQKMSKTHPTPKKRLIHP